MCSLQTPLQTLTKLLGVLFLGSASIVLADPPIVPDPAKTPGDVLTTDALVVCQKGYTKTVRDVPESLKNQIYRSYGILSHKPREYEIDHLISLEGSVLILLLIWPRFSFLV